MAYSAALGYDPDKDYSDLLANPNLSPQERTQYTGERQNKINDMYGGTEPGYNNTGSTFSELYGVNGLSGSTRSSSGSASGGSSGGGASGSAPSGGYDSGAYTPAAVSGYISPEAQRIIDSMNSNSRGWFDTDTEGQKALHLENQDFARQLEEMGLTAVYDDAKGWTVTGRQTRPAVSGGFSYESAPAYADKYTDRIDALLQGILNREGFSYDPDNDPLWSTYQNRYQREGQRAMQNTYGQQAARTGGLGSSWAQSAAQQANNYYAAQAADKIPELYQLAYQMYLDGIDQEVRNLGLLENASDTAYNRYRDTMSDWRNDRSFAYNQYRDDIADARYGDETAWNRMIYADATEYDRYNDAYNRLLSEAGTIQSMYGDDSRLAELLGYEPSETAGYQTAFRRMQALGLTSAADAMDWLQRQSAYDKWDYSEKQQYAQQFANWLMMQNIDASGLPSNIVYSNLYGPYDLTKVNGGYAAADSGGGGGYAASPGSNSAPTAKSASAADTVGAPGYGSNYSSVWNNARRKWDNGASDSELRSYINQQYENGGITRAGVDRIMSRLNIDNYREE